MQENAWKYHNNDDAAYTAIGLYESRRLEQVAIALKTKPFFRQKPSDVTPRLPRGKLNVVDPKVILATRRQR